jgi:hypothetical protein
VPQSVFEPPGLESIVPVTTCSAPAVFLPPARRANLQSCIIIIDTHVPTPLVCPRE